MRNLQQFIYTFILFFLSFIVQAEMYEVIKVRKGDTLNIRSKPDHRAKLITAIPHNATNIRHLGKQQRMGNSIWFKVTYDGAEGWVNSKYLTKANLYTTAKLVEQLTCFGTEPHWKLTRDAQSILFNKYSNPKDTFTVNKIQKSKKQSNQWKIIAGHNSKNTPMTLALTETKQCSDDMSSFIYRYKITISVDDMNLTGCCNKIGGTETE